MPKGIYPRAMTLEQRFWSKVDKNGPTMPHMSTPCWVWIGGKTGNGYGGITIRGRMRGAHRVAWELTHGPIPNGMQVLHECDNPVCVRHLFLGTHHDNIDDCLRKGRWAGAGRGSLHWSRRHPERIARGQKNGQTKLTEDQARHIKRLLAAGMRQKKVAEAMSLPPHFVANIAQGKAWAHI